MGSKMEDQPINNVPIEGENGASEGEDVPPKETSLLTDGAVTTSVNGNLNTKEAEAEEDRPKQKVKLRVPKTICLYMCFLAAGFATNILGPTLVNMRVYLHTDMESIVSAFSGAIVGWIGGSVIAGALYERFNPEIQLTIATLVMCISTAMAPWTGSLYGFILLMTIQGLGAGYIDAGGQPYGLGLWHGSKKKEPVMQATAVFTSIGSSVGPLIVSPFLISVDHLDKPDNSTTEATTNLSSEVALNTTTLTTFDNATTLAPFDNATTPAPFDTSDMLVGYAYVTLSIYMCVATCCVFIVYIANGPTCRPQATAKAVTKEGENHPEDFKFKVTIYVLLYLFFVLLMWISGLGHLLPALVTEGLHWDVQKGSLIASLFWGMLGVGRVCGIPFSTKLSPAQMLLMDTSLAVVALTLMSSVTFTHDGIMWFSAALAGFATASEFVSAVLWASKYIKFTGAVAAICITGMGTGGIGGVQVAGYLFDKDMYIPVIYCSLIATIVHLLLFIFMHLFAETYYKRVMRNCQKNDEKKEGEKQDESVATELKPLNQPVENHVENT